MSCISVPRLPAPSLPAGISIPVLTFPGIPPVDFALCCRGHLPALLPPISIGVSLSSALVTTLNGYLDATVSYINGELAAFEEAASCPLE